jgi:hypothetical protein
MTKVLAVLIGLSLAGVAQAQIKCWTGSDGKRACGDTPPPGARLETPRGAPAREASAAGDKGTPATPPKGGNDGARQPEPQKAPGTINLEKGQSAGNQQECERARELLRAMGGSGGSQRTDAVRARALAQENCI